LWNSPSKTGKHAPSSGEPLTSLLKSNFFQTFRAHLVPVISFGENEVYVQSEADDGSLLRKFQKLVKKIFKFTLPLFHGRGIFQYSMGILPYRVPIHTIVGKPIRVAQNEDPTQEEIDHFHAEYIRSLQELFDTHKKKYAKNPEMEMELR